MLEQESTPGAEDSLLGARLSREAGRVRNADRYWEHLQVQASAGSMPQQLVHGSSPGHRAPPPKCQE